MSEITLHKIQWGKGGVEGRIQDKRGGSKVRSGYPREQGQGRVLGKVPDPSDRVEGLGGPEGREAPNEKGVPCKRKGVIKE